MKKQDVKYYSDELNDDFTDFNKKPYKIKSNYCYIHKNIFYKIAAFFCYRVIMTPIAFLYCIFKHHIKIVGKEKLKPFKNKGYYLYGNHTQVPGDAYIPNMISFPKNNYVIVSPDNVSTKGTQTFMMMIGAFPIPTQADGVKNFLNALEKRTVQGNCITIYPEAHIWPYYTKIRPFKSVSFRYPIKFKDPSFSFTVTYQKRKHSKKPKMTVYIDGPFTPNDDLPFKAQQEDLRDRVYRKMCERSKESNYEYIKYVKTPEVQND